MPSSKIFWVGKTTMAGWQSYWQRLQCTPDLMPADIWTLIIMSERSFTFHPGFMFCDSVVDELNRTPPRTQSALSGL